MQFVVIVTDTGNPEFALTIAAIPVTILILVMAAFWTRRENTAGMIVVIVSGFVDSRPKFSQILTTIL